ncbi:MAG TPA: Smr/MutS family protein [bacterium]|nr:Smr/MutS family protein [bacterium]
MKRLPSHKIKQYLERPDGELDLHGQTKLEALHEVQLFLRRAEILGWHRVKIITGRGLNSPDGKAVLKESVSNWLRQADYKFKEASGKEGGPGSLVVDIG